MEKIIVCEAMNAEGKINPELRNGWKVKSVTAHHIQFGTIIFVLENKSL